ncbi:hypothetical protein [Mongoliibacter ruber]|uniref:Putative amidophosphoribosyltransferase n=1 Tax=Mongoliibacter ruber TaxID=1750599 RepID=A0A2T0WVH3_9BACT|nr:hypothetical protein [Mongoliibacter ruber]PRY90584.1 putative amidophosphoribosyltransferase [Mongoliibacter ruber]
MENLKINIYPETATEVITHTSLAKLKKQPEYFQSKYFANGVYALEMAKRLIKNESMKKIFHCIDLDLPCYIIPVQQEEKNGYNVIPLGLAYCIRLRFGFKIVKNIYRTKGFPNTGVSLRERACNNIRFDGMIPESGAQYILVDDNYTTGKTIKSLADHVTSQGGIVACITTISASRYGKQFKPANYQLSNLQKIPNFKYQLIKLYGSTEEKLTGAQIQSFIFQSNKYR